jgi:hypothetical protein
MPIQSLAERIALHSPEKGQKWTGGYRQSIATAGQELLNDKKDDQWDQSNDTCH